MFHAIVAWQSDHLQQVARHFSGRVHRVGIGPYDSVKNHETLVWRRAQGAPVSDFAGRARRRAR